MSTYIFQPQCTNSVRITITADNEPAAWKTFDSRLESLEYIGVEMPRSSNWSMISAF